MRHSLSAVRGQVSGDSRDQENPMKQVRSALAPSWSRPSRDAASSPSLLPPAISQDPLNAVRTAAAPLASRQLSAVIGAE